MTLEDEPMPSTKRPGAADANPATDWASSAGPRVYAGRIAVPSRIDGVQTAPSVSGVRPSAPMASAVQRSV